MPVTVNSARTESFWRSNDTILTDVGIDYWVEPVGVRVGGPYWGNSDILDSKDLRASVYARGKVGSISLDYQNAILNLTCNRSCCVVERSNSAQMA